MPASARIVYIARKRRIVERVANGCVAIAGAASQGWRQPCAGANPPFPFGSSCLRIRSNDAGGGSLVLDYVEQFLTRVDAGLLVDAAEMGLHRVA